MEKILPEPLANCCEGCAHIYNGVKCTVYAYPQTKWYAGPCPMATHIKSKVEMEQKALDPLKLSKKRARGLL